MMPLTSASAALQVAAHAAAPVLHTKLQRAGNLLLSVLPMRPPAAATGALHAWEHPLWMRDGPVCVKQEALWWVGREAVGINRRVCCNSASDHDPAPLPGLPCR